MSVLIRGGWVLTLDADDRELRHGDVLIGDGRITAVGTQLAAPPGAEVIDATGMVVLPGFVDTHRHTWQTMLRHRGGSWTLDDYRRILLSDRANRVGPDEVYAGTLLGALSALDSGVTTLVDWSHIQNSPAHADAAVRALTDAGLRAVFAHGWAGGDFGSPHPADIRRVRERLLPDDDALVTLAMAARGPDFTPADITAADFRLARELDIPISIHVAGGRPGSRPDSIAGLDAAGLLGPDLTVVHATAAGPDDLARLAGHGFGVSISPQTELTMPGVGAPGTVYRLRTAGIQPSLSTDTETATATDMFTQLRLALADDRSAAPDGDLLSPREVLRMATGYGARTAGLHDRTGSIEVGKAADIVLVRGTDLNLAPLTAPADALVLAAHPGNVDTVLVAGRTLKRGGRLLADTAHARTLAAAAAQTLAPPS